MAWTAPMTAAANAVFTAAQFNTHVRDNLNQTAPAKATTPGSIFVTTSLNAIAERTPTFQFIGALETTTSTTYTNLTTPGPTVTVTTGVAAIVILGAHMFNSAGTNTGNMSFTISGASTVAASDVRALRFRSSAAGDDIDATKVIYFTGLTAGSNVFTAQYRCSAGTETFENRRIDVIPL